MHFDLGIDNSEHHFSLNLREAIEVLNPLYYQQDCMDEAEAMVVAGLDLVVMVISNIIHLVMDDFTVLYDKKVVVVENVHDVNDL